ncbi:MAG: ATP-binding protein, partial [Gammaproteobacteria bacterium]
IGDNIQLKLDLPEQALFIMTNPSQLQNALLNLAINARDAMVSGGTITLSATRYYHTNTGVDLKPQLSLAPGSYVVISVSDNGIGIPAEQLSHVFEPFYTTKELGKGTGLGLSMLYSFTQQSMGACHIESTVDLGTRVEMVFPEYLEEKNTAPAADNKPMTETGIATDKNQLNLVKNHLILVVEDESRVLKLTLRDLKYLGYATITADNAAMARQIIESGKAVDLLLTDIQMPGEWNGHRLADWVRTNYPQIKIILASGYSKEPLQHAEERQGFPTLRKPYSQKVMAEMIRAELMD